MTEKKVTPEEVTLELEENPYSTDGKKPEDVVRLFYLHNVPIIPVVSKRGTLLGVLKKDAVISELSDIERAEKQKIDKFITKLARKMDFDDLLPFGNIREFVIINIFGELIGSWTRLELFTASESKNRDADIKDEADEQKEENTLEWIIYLILEHIPRALYAINENGGTIFYNSQFEDLYSSVLGAEVNTSQVEKMLGDPERNEMYSQLTDTDIRFFSKDMGVFYERVPMMSRGKKVGFLIFFDILKPEAEGLKIPGTDLRGLGLSEMIDAVERQVLIETLRAHEKPDEAAAALKMTKQALSSKMKKYSIEKNF